MKFDIPVLVFFYLITYARILGMSNRIVWTTVCVDRVDILLINDFVLFEGCI